MNQAIYANYCREFTKLSIWYARKRILDGMSDFENAINERVNIFRHTSLYKGGKRHPAEGAEIPEWNALLERVESVFDTHITDDNTTELEQKSFEILWPIIEPRVKEQKPGRPTLQDRPYEAWTRDYWKDTVNIHIANAYAPESPLSEKRTEFAAALIRLLEATQSTRPETEHVGCGSWLNSVPTFSALFPQAWMDSADAEHNVRYTLGHWGQFETRHGDFHAKNGARFRETGEFPYTSLRCQDRINSVLEHLRATFPDAVEHNRPTHGRE